VNLSIPGTHCPGIRVPENGGRAQHGAASPRLSRRITRISRYRVLPNSCFVKGARDTGVPRSRVDSVPHGRDRRGARAPRCRLQSHSLDMFIMKINRLDRINRQSSRSPRSWRWQFGYKKMMPRVTGAAACQGEHPVHARSDLMRGVGQEFGTEASEFDQRTVEFTLSGTDASPGASTCRRASHTSGRPRARLCARGREVASKHSTN